LALRYWPVSPEAARTYASGVHARNRFWGRDSETQMESLGDGASSYALTQQRTVTVSGHSLPFPAKEDPIRPSLLSDRAFKSKVGREVEQAVSFVSR